MHRRTVPVVVDETYRRSFVISFVCIILSYLSSFSSPFHDLITLYNPNINDSEFCCMFVFGLIGLIMAIAGIVNMLESEKVNRRRGRSIVFVPATQQPLIPSYPPPPNQSQPAITTLKKCESCGEMNYISTKSCTMCMYDF